MHVSRTPSVLFFCLHMQFASHLCCFLIAGRYQFSWMWSDETIALYLDLTFTGAKSPHCAAFTRTETKKLSIITCDERVAASYICETHFQTEADAATNSTSELVFPTPSDWTMESMAKCPLKHMTRNFLACDLKSSCFATDQQKSETCTAEVPPAGPYFTCRNQIERVPYSLVCDYRADCCDHSDEDFCQFPVCGGQLYLCANKQVKRNSRIDLRRIFQACWVLHAW